MGWRAVSPPGGSSRNYMAKRKKRRREIIQTAPELRKITVTAGISGIYSGASKNGGPRWKLQPTAEKSVFTGDGVILPLYAKTQNISNNANDTLISVFAILKSVYGMDKYANIRIISIVSRIYPDKCKATAAQAAGRRNAMARKENRQQMTVELARVQAYHDNGNGRMEHTEQYATMGYENGFKLRTSDRWIDISADGRTLENGNPVKGYGLEIETECCNIDDDTTLANLYKYAIFPRFPAGLYKMQHDGSLGGSSSAECITMPMTKEAVRNLYPAFHAMYDELFPAFGISCSRSGNCGMHVNISNACFGTTEEKQAEAIRKLYYIVNKHFGLMCRLFNRTGDTFYCDRMEYNNAQGMDLSYFRSNHHCSFNLGHYNSGRIELRLVGGQTDFDSFRATMETVFHLVERVKKLSWKQCDDITAIFAGCNQYVAARIDSVGQLMPYEMAEIARNVKPETGILD